MIKKIKIELIILLTLIINIFFLSYNFDVKLYNAFSNLSYGTGQTYLKDFFVRITEFGNSLWYFIVLVSILVISFLAYKVKTISFQKYLYLKNFSLYGFVCLLLVGLITQILKHLFGRARPNHVEFSENIGFNFFTTDSSFHSFPSGHTSTIMIVVLIASALLPRLRFFFYTCGLLIALSRVVAGAHFLTDIIAGTLVALIIYKLINIFFKNKYPNFYSSNFEIKKISTLSTTIVVLFILALFVTVGFSLDIYVSSLFYYDNNQFLLQSFDYLSILVRKIFLPILLIYIFILPFFTKINLIERIFFKHRFSFVEILFIWVSGIVTLLIFINILLKGFWGRSRPNDVLQFGGSDSFTPWFKIGESCVSNCSFVSGDSSVGFMLIVLYFITKKNIYCYLALIFGSLFGFIRIIAGGHFLSDIIFSNIVVTISVGLCFVLFKKIYDK